MASLHRAATCAAALVFAHDHGARAQTLPATQLDPIVVTSEADAAAALEVGPSDLERRAPQTLREVFEGEAEVKVGGGTPAAQKLYVNGLEETTLAITVDGAGQNRKIFHHAATNLLDPSLLKAVRVDAGVAPADAGPFALAGSIAFETVDAADLLEPGRAFGAQAASTFISNGSGFVNSAMAYGRFGPFDALGAARYAIGDDYEDGDDRLIRGTQLGGGSFLGKLGFEREGHRIEISAEQVIDDAPRPYRANIGQLIGRPDPIVRDYQLSRGNYVARYETTRAMGLFDPEVVIAYTESTTQVPSPFGSEGEAGGWSMTAKNRFALADWAAVTAGADIRLDRAAYSDPSTPELEESSETYGLFAQARLQPVESLSVSFGGRGDWQSFEGVDGSAADVSGLSGNLSAEWRPVRMLSLTAGVSDVFGGIQLNEPYIFNPAWVYSGLEAARGRNYVAGAELSHWGVTLGAGLFRTEVTDARDANYSAGPFQAFDFQSEGWKANIGYAWGGGFVRLTYIDADVTSSGQPADSDTLTYFGAPVGRSLALEASHELDGTGLRFGGSIEASFENDALVSQGYQALKGYQVLNLHAAYTPPRAPHFTLRVEARNLLDEGYSDRATYGQEFGSVRPMAEPGRSFLFTAQLRF